MQHKLRILLLSTAAILSIMLLWCVTHRPAQMPTVEVTAAAKENVYNSIRLSGVVESSNVQRITARKPAIVESVFVSLGQQVKEGEVLFTLRYTNDLPDDISFVQVFEGLLTEGAPNTKTPDEDDLVSVAASMDGLVLTLPTIDQSLIPGTVCAQVANLKSMQVRLGVPEIYISHLRVGQMANITSSAYPDDIVSGTLKSIAPFAKQPLNILGQDSEAEIEAVVAIENSFGKLRPGYSVSVKVFTDRIKDAVTIPYEAVIQEGQEEVVYVYVNGELHRRVIDVGYELSGGVQVNAGLSFGEMVALSGNLNYEDGMRVQAVQL